MGLLAQIEKGALDESIPLASTLRKCVVLGGHAGSSELRDWARHELDGYGDDVSEMPDYRVIAAPILANGMNVAYQFRRHQLSVWDLPDFAQEAYRDGIKMPMGVGELEKLAGNSKPIDMQAPGMPDVVHYMNNFGEYNASFESIYFSVAPTAVHGILDKIRTNLVAMVAELRAVGVGSEDIPTSLAADQAVNVIIKKAKRSPITINNAVASGPGAVASADQQNTAAGQEDESPWWVHAARGSWVFLVGLAGIIGAYAAVAAGKNWWPF
ncbi:MAG: hypothetical protein QM572_18035 [Nocardioides sp.]